MVWPFTKKTPSQLPDKLVFKSGEAFLEYQCKYGHTKIVPRQGIVAVVLDSQKEFGTRAPTKIEPDGVQIVMLKVASEDGGFVVPSRTPTGNGDRLKPDDVVIWVPIEHAMPAVDAVNEIDPRFGWVGFVVAKVLPEIDMNDPNFTIMSRYD